MYILDFCFSEVHVEIPCSLFKALQLLPDPSLAVTTEGKQTNRCSPTGSILYFPDRGLKTTPPLLWEAPRLLIIQIRFTVRRAGQAGPCVTVSFARSLSLRFGRKNGGGKIGKENEDLE